MFCFTLQEFHDCELTHNNATRGGAVSNWHGEVNLYGTNLTDNTAERVRGARVPLGRHHEDDEVDDPGKEVSV